jgi:hypothetical protein
VIALPLQPGRAGEKGGAIIPPGVHRASRESGIRSAPRPAGTHGGSGSRGSRSIETAQRPSPSPKRQRVFTPAAKKTPSTGGRMAASRVEGVRLCSAELSAEAAGWSSRDGKYHDIQPIRDEFPGLGRARQPRLLRRAPPSESALIRGKHRCRRWRLSSDRRCEEAVRRQICARETGLRSWPAGSRAAHHPRTTSASVADPAGTEGRAVIRSSRSPRDPAGLPIRRSGTGKARPPVFRSRGARRALHTRAVRVEARRAHSVAGGSRHRSRRRRSRRR